RFDFQGMVSFQTAEAVVAGNFSPKDQSYDAVATVTVTGLNILNMVTADRVVARIASSHSAVQAQCHSIVPVGAYFENLRIAGFRVNLDLATNTFTRLDTAEKVRTAYSKNENGFRDEFDQLTLTGREVPALFQKYFPCAGKRGSRPIEENAGVISC